MSVFTSASPSTAAPTHQGKSGVSKAQLRANRANAKKSTGPRTEEGKQRSSQNAIGHGLFCQNFILPGERLREFLLLRLSFHVDLRATDSVEFAIIERAAIAQWRMRRCQAAEADLHWINTMEVERQSRREIRKIQKAQNDICFDTEEEERQHKAKVQKRIEELEGIDLGDVPVDATMAAEFGKDSSALERLARYEHRLEHHFYKALRELRAYRKDKHGGKTPKSEESPPYADFGTMRREMLACPEEEEIEEEMEDLDDELDDERDASEDDRDEREEHEEREDHEEDEDKVEKVTCSASLHAAAQNEANLSETLAGDEVAESCERGSSQEAFQIENLKL